MVTTASAELIKRSVPPLAALLVARLVEVPKVKRTLRRVDAKLIGTAIRQRRSIFRPGRIVRVVAGLAIVFFGAAMVLRGARAAAE